MITMTEHQTGIDYVKRKEEVVHMSDKNVQSTFKYAEGHFESNSREEKAEVPIPELESEDNTTSVTVADIEYPESVEKEDVRRILKSIDDIQPKHREEPLHGKLYLKSFCYGLHSYELQNATRLTLLTKSSGDTKILDDAAETIKDSLLPSLLFIDIKAMHHLEPLKEAYIERFPGLVHFMLIDRTNDRLFAPQISSLEGKEFQHPTNHPVFQKVIKQQIRDIVRRVHNEKHLLTDRRRCGTW